jgi:UDP-N-acetylglucosamine 1-carboxyvinyltransferase
MDKLLIEGGRPLEGEVRVSGAKNAALPILCAALLAREPLVLTNVPQLKDVRTMRALLAQMGVAQDAGTPGTIALDAGTIDWPLAPYELVKTMRVDPRAWPACCTLREARVSLPAAARSACVPSTSTSRASRRWARDRSRAWLHQRQARRLAGTRFVFDVVTVTGTENLLMAATSPRDDHARECRP